MKRKRKMTFIRFGYRSFNTVAFLKNSENTHGKEKVSLYGWPSVWLGFTPSMLFSFIVKFVQICHVKSTKINKKRPSIAH